LAANEILQRFEKRASETFAELNLNTCALRTAIANVFRFATLKSLHVGLHRKTVPLKGFAQALHRCFVTPPKNGNGLIAVFSVYGNHEV